MTTRREVIALSGSRTPFHSRRRSASLRANAGREGPARERHMLKRLFGAGLAALAGVAFAAGASAQTLDKIKSRGVLVVGTKADYKPFGFRDPSGAIVGFEPDIGKEVADKLGTPRRRQRPRPTEPLSFRGGAQRRTRNPRASSALVA